MSAPQEGTTSEPPSKVARVETTVAEQAHRHFATQCMFGVRPDELTAAILHLLQPHQKKEHLEIELRLCTLIGSERGDRLRPPCSTPCLVNSGLVRKSVSGVQRFEWDGIRRLIDSTWEPHLERAQGAATVTHRHTRDTVLKGVRISRDVETGAVTERVKKQRLVVGDIACPQYRYDLRMAVNQEVPVLTDDERVGEGSDGTGSSSSGGSGGFTRVKNRTSYVAGPFSFDLTEVAASGAEPATFEVEIEIMIAQMKGEPLESVVQTLLRNAFSLLAHLSRK